jgi:predicted ATPase
LKAFGTPLKELLMKQHAERSHLIGNRYRLVRKIGEGGMGTVFEAEDRLNAKFVALKCLKSRPDQDYSDTHQRQLLAREFQTLAGLRHPHIISVLDFGYDSQLRPYFTMPLLHGARNILEVAAERMLHGKVRLLIEMLQALNYLHRHGILHLDLKPSNVLVEPNGRVRVLDFGIATELTHAPEIGGTLEYISPEMLNGEPIEPASDLYAVGVIAYQIFAGEHPFAANGIAQLIYRVLTERPDSERLAAPEAVRQVIMRLLAKKPSERYASAYEATLAFCQAIQVAPSETYLLRESVLQSPKFVGREAELRMLDQALAEALHKRGSAWLVGGESGVGKSRLLDELRIRALVKGVIVLHGQYLEGAGGLYSAWRDAIRRLALLAPLDDDEALMLQSFIPDLPRLIGRAVEGTPQAITDQRLASLLVALIERAQQPILLLMDDLQWATDDLSILRHLSKVAPRLPLMIVAAYRNDEAHYLYGRLPEMRLIKLARFSAAESSQLSRSIIGQAETLERFLFEQTEGNAFYLIESLRSLAESLGSLERIRQAEAPRQLFSDRMALIAQRRLMRLSERHQALVKIAAVIGRELNFELLERVGGEANYDDWLIKCVDIALFRIEHDKWYFTHDKLREGVLHLMPLAERRELHRAVAEGIEALYPDQPDYELALSIHWRQAGELARAVRYLIAYASRTLPYGSASAVKLHLEELLQQTEPLPELITDRFHIYMLLGKCEEDIGTNVRARECYQRAHAIAVALQDHVMQATALFSNALVERSMGNFASSLEQLHSALSLFQAHNQPQQVAQALFAIGHVETLRMNLERAEQYLQQALQVAEQHQDKLNVARAHMGLSDTARRQRDFERAERHAKAALERYAAQGEDRLLATILMRLSLVYMDQRRFEEALPLAERSIQISQRLGDFDSTYAAIGNIGFALAQQERYEESRAYFERAIAYERQYGDWNTMAVRLGALAQVNVRLADWTAVRANLYEWLQLARRLDNLRGLLHGFYGMVYLALHDGNAIQAAEWIGVIEANATPEYLDSEELAGFRAACLAHMDERQLAESIAYGKTLDLNALADRLLSDSEGIFGPLIAAEQAQPSDSDQAVL